MLLKFETAQRHYFGQLLKSRQVVHGKILWKVTTKLAVSNKQVLQVEKDGTC